MPEMFQTTDGYRPDLLAELKNAGSLNAANPQLGYIGTEIFPVVQRTEKSGYLYYQTLDADSAAQTNRTLGAAPTETLLTNSSTTFTCTEKIKRYGITEDEVKTMGGIERADMKAAKAAVRSVLNNLEEQVADAILLASTTLDDIESSFLKAVGEGVDAVRRYYGKTAFVCSYTVARRIMRYTEVANQFKYHSPLPSGIVPDVIGHGREMLRAILQGILPVDTVLIGDDVQWYDSDAAKQGRAAIVKIPPQEDMVFKDGPVLGVNNLFYHEDGIPCELYSWWDPDDKTNKYDATMWNVLNTLNAGAIYLLEGIDEGNVEQTSTTTTTGA